jgi:hypothetical protein
MSPTKASPAGTRDILEPEESRKEHRKDWARLVENNEEIGSNLQNTVEKKVLLMMTPCLWHGNQGLGMKAHFTKGDRCD